MLTIDLLDTQNRSHVQRFIRLPFRLYKDTPQWVPPLLVDATAQLDRRKHPFYEHSDGDFFIARQDGQDVGRLAVFENRPYNRYHETKVAQFYLFDSIDDPAVAEALFARAFEWAHQRGLQSLIGPKGLGALDGYGVLVEGFEHRQMMTMMNYNFPYYSSLLEGLSFTKEVDFVSAYVSSTTFHLPERIHHIAGRVAERGGLAVKRFRNKKELVSWAPRIGQAYNKAFIKNWEYYPFSERELKFVIDSIMTIANPQLIKIITHKDDVVGFLFAFPDISAAIQRSGGRLAPFGLVDILLEMRRTKWVAMNGAGILPEFHGRGGNALLYAEMEKTVSDFGFEHLEMTQVAETAVTMRADLENLGGKAYKNHRVYHKAV